MEKRFNSAHMEGVNCLRKIVVTGPESVGKTTLSEALVKRLDAVLLPEYARSYVEALSRPYQYSDLEKIARFQIEEERRVSGNTDKSVLILDTWLIITKVWFEVVYGESPSWIETYLASSGIDLFLVCKPDLPWVADHVRENGGEMRNQLFNRYCSEIERLGFTYEIVGGVGPERVQNALHLLSKHGFQQTF